MEGPPQTPCSPRKFLFGGWVPLRREDSSYTSWPRDGFGVNFGWLNGLSSNKTSQTLSLWKKSNDQYMPHHEVFPLKETARSSRSSAFISEWWSLSSPCRPKKCLDVGRCFFVPCGASWSPPRDPKPRRNPAVSQLLTPPPGTYYEKRFGVSVFLNLQMGQVCPSQASS